MTRWRRRISAAGEDSGFVLATVLWLIAALAALASIYLTYAEATAASSAPPGERLRTEAAIRAGLELAAFRVMTATDPTLKRQGRFEARLGEASLAVDYRTEGARIDLNAAPIEVLAGLLRALGLPEERVKAEAQRIVDWRTPANSQAGPDLAADYRAAGLHYGPRQGPFDDPLELSLVLGLPEPIAAAMQRYVTVYTGQAKLDALAADPVTLEALPGFSADALQAFLKARADPETSQTVLNQALGAAVKYAQFKPAVAMRADIRVDFGRGRKAEAEIVFRPNDKGESPFEVLQWRDGARG